jgi:hypothetical protein
MAEKADEVVRTYQKLENNPGVILGLLERGFHYIQISLLNNYMKFN